MRFFTFLETPNEFNLRPLLLVAGAAAVTAGAYYLLSSKFGNRQQRATTVDVLTQRDPEGKSKAWATSVDVLTQPDPEGKSKAWATAVDVLTQPDPEGDDESSVDLRDDLLTLYDGLIRRLDTDQPEETTEENRLCTVNLPYFNQETVQRVHHDCALVHKARSIKTRLDEFELDWPAPVGLKFPGLVLEPLVHGEMHSAFRTVLFSHRWWHNCGNRRICVLRHCALVMRGPVTFAWWILTNDFFVVSGKCPTLYATVTRVTVTKRVDGHLTRVTSFMFTKESSSKTSNGFQETVVSHTGQALIIDHDEYAYCEFSEVVPQPEASTSSPQAGPEAAGGCGSAVAREVPSLYTYSEIQGIENFALKMKALRQAFNIILSEKECLDYVCETGRVIFSDLATLSNKDLTVIEYLYDTLLSIAQSPSYRADVEAELAEIGIENFNFMDVVYETIMLRIQAGTGPDICPRPGGFLHHLMALLTSFSAATNQSRPRGEQYFCLVQNAMMVFLGKIFTLEESVYEDPRTLVHVVWDIFEEDAEDLLDRLEDI